MTLKVGTSQACAACKYQRRRCLPECQLAPYFPADRPKMFQNAHRLYGVSNIIRILNLLEYPCHRREAMRSIIYESDMRDKYPVSGCFGLIHQLSYQIQILEDQLQEVYLKIDLCKTQNAKNQIIHADGFSWNEQFWGHGSNNNNLMEADHQQLHFEEMSSPNPNETLVHHMHPFFDAMESSTIDSKEAYESSSSHDSSVNELRDAKEHRSGGALCSSSLFQEAH